MRSGWLIFGVLLGVAGYMVWTNQAKEQAVPAATVDATGEPKHRVQDDKAKAAVGAMIDEVVHHPDIPETPVKQAFEHAIES
jgi:hypothetical protein